MADQPTIDEYKKWWHEKKRAVFFGHPNYASNCQTAMDAMKVTNPELDGLECGCQCCLNNDYPS